MIAIADNLNTRNHPYMAAVSKRDKKTAAELVKTLTASGADMINIQCSLDGVGDEETLPWVAGIISEAGECGISLDSRNTQAIKKNALSVQKTAPRQFYLEDRTSGKRRAPFPRC